MQRVRLMCWCTSCVGGAHLPAFAAAEGGLFAEHGLEVEFVRAPAAPDWTLRGFGSRLNAVAAGDADFALTSIAYLASAQAEAGGCFPARFVAVSHQHNPIAAVVREDSDIRDPADLPRARAARWCMPWFTEEYVGALAHLELGRATVVGSSEGVDLETLGGMNRALGGRAIDVIPVWMDMTPYHREARFTDAGFPTRVIALDIEVYTTGLLAADRLPLELVTRMRDAFAAGYELQREDPEPGIAAFRRRFSDISEEQIRANWALFEPYAFDGAAPGSMDAGRWQTTIGYTAATHGLPVFAAESLYRPELLAPALAAAAA